MQASRLLLALLVKAFGPEGTGLVFVVDETLERRAGKRIGGKAGFRHAVRSSGKNIVVSQGIRGCCLCLLVPVPWARRPWALPFVCVSALSEKTCKRLGKPHKSGIARTIRLRQKLRVWYPETEMTLRGDGGYAAVEVAAACQKMQSTLISRLRRDAGWYAFPAAPPKSKRGPKPQKGVRLPTLAPLRTDPRAVWCQTLAAWYGADAKIAGCRTGVCLWDTPAQKPVPLR